MACEVLLGGPRLPWGTGECVLPEGTASSPSEGLGTLRGAGGEVDRGTRLSSLNALQDIPKVKQVDILAVVPSPFLSLNLPGTECLQVPLHREAGTQWHRCGLAPGCAFKRHVAAEPSRTLLRDRGPRWR